MFIDSVNTSVSQVECYTPSGPFKEYGIDIDYLIGNTDGTWCVTRLRMYVVEVKYFVTYKSY